MFAYILKKSRHLKRKWVRNREVGYFKYKGFEYNIVRKKMYTQKWLIIKTVFFSFYLEGVADPIEFDEKSYKLDTTDVPIDEMALLVRKIIRGLTDLIIILLIALSLFVNIYVAWLVSEIGNKL